MLEDRSCLISRSLASTRLAESNWSMLYPEDASENKLGSSKRALEVAGEIRQTKSIKLMGFSINYDSDSSNYSSSGEGQGDAFANGDDGSSESDNGGDSSSDFSLSSGGEGGQGDADIGDGSSSGDEQDQSDSNENGGDSSDSHSLINEIGRDNSINCMIRCSRSDYGSIASLNRNFRSLVKSGEIYRLRRQNGFVEHWVYFSCQLLEWVAFDPVKRRWMELPTMPSSVTFMCADKESLAVGTDLLVLGQDGFSSHVIYKYSLLTNSWSSGMSMNTPRCLFGSASLGEIAIFAGGCDSKGKILDFAEMYNSELQAWVTLPRMNKQRKMCSGVFMDGKFYVIGGIGGADSKVLTCGEEYDLETKKWTQVPDLSPPRSSADQADMTPAAEAPPLVAVVNNQLYAADHADMEVRKYDKENKRWLTVGRLPERAGSVNGWGLAFRACGERLIVIGGPKHLGGGFIELNSWIPSVGGPPQWTLLGRKHSSNFVYNCAVMGC